jgi:hypothetical protein
VLSPALPTYKVKLGFIRNFREVPNWLSLFRVIVQTLLALFPGSLQCCFLRLPMVRIFPRVSDQTKKVVAKWTLVYQILFQVKRKPSIWTRTLQKNERAKQSLSSPFCLPLMEYKKLKIEAKISTSQSWAPLAKITFHWLEPPESFKWATTKASFVYTCVISSI